jgi:hypothetical protein
MHGRSPRARLKRRSSGKSAKTTPRVLRVEWLEPRALLSSIGLGALPVLWRSSLAAVRAATPANAAPTVAQAINANGNVPVTGRTAALSVLGKDDGTEARLTYTWSVTSAPLGGTASFNVNGSNAAKYATATFSKAGTYTFTVRIADAQGLAVTSSRTVVVSPTLSSVSLSTVGGQAIGANSTLLVSAAVQAFAAQARDQFGNAISATFNWSRSRTGSGPMPSLSTNTSVASLGFSSTGIYGLSVQARSGSKSVAANVSIVVTPSLSAIRNVPSGSIYVSGTSLQLPLPTFVDQFGGTLTTPALTWTTTTLPAGASVPTFTTNGGLTTVTFAMAGTYSFNARVTSAPKFSFNTTVVVNQSLTSIAVAPSVASVVLGATQQFTAQGLDQFRKAMVVQPTFAWATSGGTISSSGLLTAPGSGASCAVTARSGSVAGTAAVTLVARSNTTGLKNAALASLVQTLYVDGSINRQDMIQILRSTGADGVVDAIEFTDLKSLLNQATTFAIPEYVRVLAGDVVNGNQANAKFQGQSLGNLAAGSSTAQLNKLVDKWFLGADRPTLTSTSLVYRQTSGSLFARTPSHLDEVQGMLGDCYLVSALGTLADSNPAAVQNMFIDNGDGTFTVRFYYGTYGAYYNSDGSISAGFTNNRGVADYVTVDRMLATTSSGYLAYSNYGSSYTNSSNTLWIALAEKAYAQWNETGREGRDGRNAYASIEGGWMSTVDAQVLGYNATNYIMSRTGKQAAIDALNAKKAVTIGTLSWSGTKYGLYATHAYAIIGYSASTDKFTLYNPWGSNQPQQVTWAQLQETCSQMSVASTSGTTAIARTASPARVSSGALSASLVDAAFATDYLRHHQAA